MSNLYFSMLCLRRPLPRHTFNSFKVFPTSRRDYYNHLLPCNFRAPLFMALLHFCYSHEPQITNVQYFKKLETDSTRAKRYFTIKETCDISQVCEGAIQSSGACGHRLSILQAKGVQDGSKARKAFKVITLKGSTLEWSIKMLISFMEVLYNNSCSKVLSICKNIF